MRYRIGVILFICFVAFVANTSSTSAQQKSPAPPAATKDEPATKFDRFLSRKGKLLIKEFYDIGVFIGTYGRVKIQAVALSEAGSSDKTYAVRLEQPKTREYGSDQVAVLDFDELVSLQDALDYMIKLAPTMGNQARPYTEVEFSSRGNLKAGFYQSAKGQSAFLQLSHYSSDGHMFFNTDSLKELRTLVSQAREKLTSLGAK